MNNDNASVPERTVLGAHLGDTAMSCSHAWVERESEFVDRMAMN
jgi:hypothetical protein